MRCTQSKESRIEQTGTIGKTSMSQENREAVLRAMRDFEHRQKLKTRSSNPDAPGSEHLNDAQREEARTQYGKNIMNRPAGTWTQEEQQFIHQSILAALKENG